MRDWKIPAPDPDRPECPYIPGFVMQATEHEPPTPFGRGQHYPKSTRTEPPLGWIEDLPQTRYVLEYPPLETQWPHGKPRRTATITVTGRIPNGRDRRAKLVVCEVLVGGNNRPYTAVAKVYDALYYDAEEIDETWIVSNTDEDYSKEAWAYSTLQTTKRPQKPGFAPAYFGSWTFDLSLTLQGKAYKRPVRFILIEHIHGACMRDLMTLKNHDSDRCRCSRIEHYPDAFQYDEAYRLDVLAQLLEGIVRQRHAGVAQADHAPRNVMLVPSPRGAPEPLAVPRVVLIDYNQARIDQYGRYRHLFPSDKPLPQNPAEHFWNTRFSDFHGWRPDEWASYSKEARDSVRNWLIRTFVQNGADKFRPIKDEILEEISDLLAPKHK
ncbi:hypothetical protein NPX13_g1728 [Xylaria arbuscula]|uniref:Protein kinase domain-containing protein n=1 Tax=Xylaria arbuscula TaxID=114810 RepID=A0A9W8NKH2_9PEZI|nr:hypothetical protein NPX13_g1728 [Xylaria arbuscula]